MADDLSEPLWFRTLKTGDAPLVHELHGDSLTNEHTPPDGTPDHRASSAMLETWLRHQTEHGFGCELAFHDKRLAGICGARRDLWQGRQVINLYWRLHPDYRGKGLAGILGLHALEIARSDARPAGDLIVARIRPDNTRSIRVAEKLGLTRRSDLESEMYGVHWILFAIASASNCSTRPLPHQL